MHIYSNIQTQVDVYHVQHVSAYHVGFVCSDNTVVLLYFS